MTQYRLTRQLPDGQVKAHSTLFTTRHKAAQAAFYVLFDNQVANRREATEFASRLQDTPLGVSLSHASGYSFTITEVKKT